MQNLDTKAILRELHELGVFISIDDFGTGYCSVSYLKNFPIDTLKIDRSFVCDVTKDTNDAAIITAIAGLAHKLNLEVVAEGVETEEQRNLVLLISCMMQDIVLYQNPCRDVKFYVSTFNLLTQIQQRPKFIANS